MPSAVSMIIRIPDQLDPDHYVSDNLHLLKECAVQLSLPDIENTIIASPSSVANSLLCIVTNLLHFECHLYSRCSNNA